MKGRALKTETTLSKTPNTNLLAITPLGLVKTRNKPPNNPIKPPIRNDQKVI